MPKCENLLTMDRQGEFPLYAYGANHCGVENNITVKYRMLCVCDTILDRRGFLFDQINVDNYFQAIKRSRLSCERLAVKCVEDLRRMIRVENPTCVVRRMELTLSPQPFKASMTRTWVNSKFLPAYQR